MESLGVKILVANEIDETRAKFYQDVYKDTHMVCGDITDDSVRDSIVAESIRKNVDFITLAWYNVNNLNAFEQKVVSLEKPEESCRHRLYHRTDFRCMCF